MKKKLLVTLLVLMLVFLAVGAASAKNNKINIKGYVLSKEVGTLTVESKKGTFVVTVPAGFVFDEVEVGDSVLIKGRIESDGSIVAETIKQVGKGNTNGEDDPDEIEEEEGEELEGGKANSAYCMEGKKDTAHPLAIKLAERYGATGVTEEWVMGYYCDGYSIGAIMLAIKTSQIEGMDVDPDTLLETRSLGTSWGHIWQDLKLIGSAKNGHSPYGQLKKQQQADP